MRVARRLGMRCRMGAVINRFDGNGSCSGDALAKADIDMWGVIPEDEELKKNDREGRTIFELSPSSPFIGNVEEIVCELWSKKGGKLTWANKKS